MLQISEETTCEICGIFKSTYFEEHLQTVASKQSSKMNLAEFVFFQRILGKNGLNVPEKIKLQTRWYSIAGQGTKMNYLMKRT